MKRLVKYALEFLACLGFGAAAAVASGGEIVYYAPSPGGGIQVHRYVCAEPAPIAKVAQSVTKSFKAAAQPVQPIQVGRRVVYRTYAGQVCTGPQCRGR